MQAWLPLILLWFVSLFTSTLAVITYIYRYLNNGNYRLRRSIHKYLPPWVLLALLIAAFMVGIIWLLVSSKESDVNRMKRHVWLFLILFVGLFLVICVITTILWSNLHERAYRKRIAAGQMKHDVESVGRRSNHNSEFATTSSLERDKTTKGPLGKYTNHELNSSCHRNLCERDDILVLRNLSNPNEEFCISLSDSTAPVAVVRRKSFSLDQDTVQENVLPKSRIVTLEGDTSLDFEC